MKSIAAILIIAFMAFSGEQLILPVTCMELKPVTVSGCCAKSSHAPCKKSIAACHKKQQNERLPGGCENFPANCLFCPNCVTLMHEASFEMDLFAGSIKPVYADRHPGPLPQFSNAHWKPPNGLLS